ncbi:hypothetical protein ACX818_001394 [Acinetobacter baumannii]
MLIRMDFRNIDLGKVEFTTLESQSFEIGTKEDVNSFIPFFTDTPEETESAEIKFEKEGKIELTKRTEGSSYFEVFTALKID